MVSFFTITIVGQNAADHNAPSTPPPSPIGPAGKVVCSIVLIFVTLLEWRFLSMRSSMRAILKIACAERRTKTDLSDKVIY